ncbi:MAG: NAD(P)-dependent oxidoreductase [Pseudomonadota bacterium]
MGRQKTLARATLDEHDATRNRADLTVTLMMMLEQGQGTSLIGKTLGIVGGGPFADELARRARDELGMEVSVASVAEIETVVATADVLALAATDCSEALIAGPELDRMKDSASLVNTCSAHLVDQTALAQALMFDVIAGAALDIYGYGRLNPLLAQCPSLVTMDRMLPELA